MLLTTGGVISGQATATALLLMAAAADSTFPSHLCCGGELATAGGPYPCKHADVALQLLHSKGQDKTAADDILLMTVSPFSNRDMALEVGDKHLVSIEPARRQWI
jgi:hypothetical protein